MRKSKCQYCEWETPKAGRWARHWQLRNHIHEAHPAAFTAMSEAEAAISVQIGQLFKQFGEGAKQRF